MPIYGHVTMYYTHIWSCGHVQEAMRRLGHEVDAGRLVVNGMVANTLTGP